jgi:hypothetical protein
VAALTAARVPEAAQLLRRLPGSFVTLYVSRHRLDPVYAAYVQGRPHRLVATHLFYRHVQAPTFIRAYWAAATAVHGQLRRAAGYRVARSGPDAVPAPVPASLATLGYGSRLVPRPGVLRTFWARAQQELAAHAQTTDPIGQREYHNRFTLVSVLLLYLGTGARPSGAEAFSANVATAHPTRLRLADKNSPRFFEVRTLRRTALVTAVCHELRAAQEHARYRLPHFAKRAYAQLGRPLIFFLDRDGTPVHATAQEIRRRLDAWERLAAVFPFPLNVGRHRLETWLGEHPADWDAKDYALGH